MGSIIQLIIKFITELFSDSKPYKNILLVAVTVLVVKLFGFAKEAFISNAFGMSNLLDSFFILVLVPVFFKNVFIGAFKAVFIPNFINAKNKKVLYNNLILLTMILSVILALFVYLILPYINAYLTRSYSNEISKIVFDNQYIFLICIPLWSFSALISGFLDIKKRFVISAFVPVVSSLTIIFFLFVFEPNITYLFYAFIFGAFLEFIYFYIIVPLKFEFSQIDFSTEDTKILLKQFTPKLVSGLIIGLNPVIDQFFSSSIGDGAISTLNYGSKFPVFATSILSISVGNVLLPYFAELKNINSQQILKDLNKKAVMVFLIGVFCTIFMLIFGESLVTIFFEHGEFNSKDTKTVTNVLKMFSFQIPFYILNIMLVRFLTAFNLNIFNIISSSVAVILNVIFNYLFIETLGISGIALSTSLVIFFSFALKYLYIQIKFSNA